MDASWLFPDPRLPMNTIERLQTARMFRVIVPLTRLRSERDRRARDSVYGLIQKQSINSRSTTSMIGEISYGQPFVRRVEGGP
jgi:hypothetical protein